MNILNFPSCEESEVFCQEQWDLLEGREKKAHKTPLCISIPLISTQLERLLVFSAPLESMLTDGVRPGYVKTGPFQTISTI